MTQPQDREALAAEAEEQRQRDQAAAEHDRQRAEEEGAAFRERQAQAERDIHPNSPAGQEAAMRRGDPVQLTGDERDQGRREGVHTTSNESAAVRTPAGTNETDFVTGGAGHPIPASAGIPPQVPGSIDPGEARWAERPDVTQPVGERPEGTEPWMNEGQVAETPEQRAEREQRERDQQAEGTVPAGEPVVIERADPEHT